MSFGDDYTLNPEWCNIGNGILEVNKKGFGKIAYSNEVETEVELDENGSPVILGNYGWDTGSNNIDLTQAEQLTKFATKEDAMDLELELTDDDGTTIDFFAQNPNTVYVPIQNFATLGMRVDSALVFGSLAKTLELQNLYWVQNVVVKFFSCYSPLAGDGNDPVDCIKIPPPPPPAPKVSLWNQFIFWLMDTFGMGQNLATFIAIASVIIGIIIILVILGVIFPPFGQMLLTGVKWIGRGIMKGFKFISSRIRNANQQRRKRKARS